MRYFCISLLLWFSTVTHAAIHMPDQFIVDGVPHEVDSSPLETGNDLIPLTASVGVDEFKSTHTDNPQGFIERVDAWLYQAKKLGRNLVKGPVVSPVDTNTNVTADEKEALFGVFKKPDA